MSKLVFDAIGKYIHPTRYRQIVETQSLDQLTSEEQRILSEDQKHSSAVAKVHNQKRRSREVALRAHECLQKLQGSTGSEVDEDVQARFGGSTSSSTLSADTMENASLSRPRKGVTFTENLRIQRKLHRVMKFTAGIDRHGYGQWTASLRDSDFKLFQEGRTADSLKKRAGLKMPLVQQHNKRVLK